jgi:hypothetical protein
VILLGDKGIVKQGALRGALKSCWAGKEKVSEPVKLEVIKPKSKQEAQMECSTKAVEMMAEIMVQEMQQVGLEAGDMRTIETGMREMLRAVGAQALGQHFGSTGCGDPGRGSGLQLWR